MSGAKGPEALETRGQSRDILARVRPAFRDHVRPHTEEGEGERLGGGSILNARWNHRLSRDLDVYVRLRTTEDGRTILDRAAKACGGYRIEHPTFRRIEFERDQENHVDVTFGQPSPAEGEKTVIVDGEPARVLSNAQIMSGKLLGRGMTAPARDLVDIAACAVADPEALEIAVNSLDDEKANAILRIYEEMAEEYARDTGRLEGVPAQLEPVRQNPTGYAAQALHAARYVRVEMRTRDGAAEIETTTREGTRTRRYEDAEGLQRSMERDGINAFLTAQVRDQHAVLDAMVDALWNGRDTTVLSIEPERLRATPAQVPALEWQPGGGGGAAGIQGGRHSCDRGHPMEARRMNWQKMNPGKPGVLVWFLATCLVAGGGALTAQEHVTGQWDQEAAAAYLDQRQSWWAGWSVAARDNGTYCISCHTVVPYALARPHVREGSDAKPNAAERGLLANVSQRVRQWQELAPEGDQARGTESVLNALVLASSDARTGKLGRDTRMAFDHLWATQARTGDLEGAWPWFVVDLQPWESDDAPFYGAALAALAVGTAPEGYASTDEARAGLERLRSYLDGLYDRQPLFNRLTLLWASTTLPGLLDSERQAAIIEEVLARQEDDGGWSLAALGEWERTDGTTLPTGSDGHATGLVAFTLLRAGLPSENDQLRQGLSWLRRHQDPADGSWWAESLNKERDPTSDVGRFMRDAATAYAVLALTASD